MTRYLEGTMRPTSLLGGLVLLLTSLACAGVSIEPTPAPTPAPPAPVVGPDGLTLYVPAADDPTRTEPVEDVDGDGFSPGDPGPLADCNDRDDRIHPGRDEATAPNGVDDNCDGRIDEGTVVYDDDGDGLSEVEGDCNDGDDGVYPQAPEIADCRDQDCDGTIDEGVRLSHTDDAYEPNTSERPFDLRTSRERRFRRTLELVTRERGDEEWFSFFSQDGEWDDWRIEATVLSLPQGGGYRLELRGDAGSVLKSAVIQREGDGIELRGAAFRDDSGTYELGVVPLRMAQMWCPVRVELRSY